ncbi:PEP-CTERM sorting domain-containing protein [Pseudoduganella danionis]|uniref:PEP-CTERM sorting domain-containing protein n=1 Tax=Pseudoduganella danionis TaxID=1890295 RepID=UPI0035B029DB
MKKTVFTVLALAAGLSQAAILHDNGPVVDASSLSVLAGSASILGWGEQASAGNRMADDFTIANGSAWNVSSVSFFAYQTGATSFTFTNAVWSIVAGNDVNTGSVVASGTTSVSNAGQVGYRVTSSTLASTIRPIYQLEADIPDVTLASGHYWLTWSIGGTLASGPWQPPTADARTGNAMQATAGGAFATVIDSGSNLSAEMPFLINGTVAAVPEPETYAMLLGGLGLIGLARRRVRSK